MTDVLGLADPVGEDELVCSAKGCQEAAAWGLLWNNPKIHTPERRKVWLACDAHREHLETFLGARSFWRSSSSTGTVERRAAP